MNRRRTSTHVLTHTARRSPSEYMVAALAGGKVVTTALTNVRDGWSGRPSRILAKVAPQNKQDNRRKTHHLLLV